MKNTAKQLNLKKMSTRYFALLIITGSILSFTMISCKKDIKEKPVGDAQAIAVYNQAYNENFDADEIDFILNEAKNSYVLVDPFMAGVAEQIPAIKANGNQVGAYISVGTGENWRDDFDELLPFLVTKQWDQWDGEYFVSVTTIGVIDIMKARIDKIADWGCDWVEFDNMDWVDDIYREEYGYEVTDAEAIAYFQELCYYVQEKGMKCMAKNRTTDAPMFDGVLMESYIDEKNWWDNAGVQSFLDAGKLVIISHYKEPRPNMIYQEYIDLYDSGLSFICESSKEKGYVHFNQE